MVRPERFELPTLWFVAKYSIQLSYGRTHVVSGETIARLSGIGGLRNRNRAGLGVRILSLVQAAGAGSGSGCGGISDSSAAISRPACTKTACSEGGVV
jgi:hypothetical protein